MGLCRRWQVWVIGRGERTRVSFPVQGCTYLKGWRFPSSSVPVCRTFLHSHCLETDRNAYLTLKMPEDEPERVRLRWRLLSECFYLTKTSHRSVFRVVIQYRTFTDQRGTRSQSSQAKTRIRSSNTPHNKIEITQSCCRRVFGSVFVRKDPSTIQVVGIVRRSVEVIWIEENSFIWMENSAGVHGCSWSLKKVRAHSVQWADITWGICIRTHTTSNAYALCGICCMLWHQ